MSFLGVALSSTALVTQPALGGGITRHVLIGGDSIGNRLIDPAVNNITLKNKLATFGINATVTDGAQGGKGLSDFIIMSSGAKGAMFTVVWDALSNKSDITDIVMSIAANDIGDIEGGTYTAQQWEDRYVDLVALMFTQFTALENVILVPPTRHIGDNSTSAMIAWEELRVRLPSVASRANTAAPSGKKVQIGAPAWDLNIPVGDNVHFDSDGALVFARRIATQLAYMLDQTDLTLQGLSMVSAVSDATGLLVTLDNPDSSDITVDSSPALEQFRLLDGSTVVPISGIERVDSNKIRLVTGAPWTKSISINNLYGTLFGTENGTTRTGLVDTVRDTSEFTLPMKKGIITSTAAAPAGDKILELTNLHTDLNPAYDKTLNGSSVVTQIKSINGTSIIADTDGLTFDATAHNTRGGFRGRTGAGSLTTRGANPFPAGSEVVVGFTIDIPSTIAAFQAYLSFGRSAGYGDARAKINGHTDGNMYGYRDGNDDWFTVVTGGELAGEVMFFIYEVTATHLIITWDSASGNTSGSVTLTRSIIWGSVTDVFFGGNGLAEGMDANHIYGRSFLALGREVGDPTNAELISYMKSSQGY